MCDDPKCPGWCHMTDSMGNGPGIERCDACGKFDSDEDAARAHAATGCCFMRAVTIKHDDTVLTDEEIQAASIGIVFRWVEWLTDEESAPLLGGDPLEYLKLAAADSTTMHNVCDANEFFQEVLVGMGLVTYDTSYEEQDAPETKLACARNAEVWNAVLCNGHLERAATEILLSNGGA